MNRLFLASRVKLYLGLYNVLILLGLGGAYLLDSLVPLWAVLAASLALTAWAVHEIARPFAALEKIKRMVQSGYQGRFHHRVTGMQGMGEIGQLAWEANEMFDQIETFTREVKSAFQYVSQEKYYRRPMAEGLQGEFAAILRQIDEALGTIEKNNHFIVRNRLVSEMQGLNTVHMLRNLRLSQSDLSRINGELSGVDDQSRENAEKAHASAEVVEHLTRSLERTQQLVREGNTSIQEMDRMGEEISGVLGLINQIAEKTNLLALNASIEAARAGEHGRGFAVVADEVKTLAQNTKQATDEIARVVEHFRSDSTTMLENSGEIATMTEEVTGEIHGLRERFREFSDSAQQTHSAVDFAANVAFVSLVKVDHLIYKQNGYQAFRDGRESEAAQAVEVDHHHCRLGRWYDTEGADKFGDLQAFHRLSEPHQQVHDNMRRILDLLDENWETDPDLQNQILETYRREEEISEAVLSGLDALIEEKYPHRAA